MDIRETGESAPVTVESAPAPTAWLETEKPLNFKIDIFDGPLDLLLHLVKENQMDINAIPITEITQQYLDYLKLMEELNLELAGDYLEMAATLIKWKARSLLPGSAIEDEEEEGDPQANLAKMLREYQKFKAAGGQLKNLYETQLDFLTRPSDAVDKELFRGEEVYAEASLFELLRAFKRIVDTVGKTLPREIEGDEYTVEGMMTEILERVRMVEFIRFADLFFGRGTLMQIIVTFLALLELTKKQEIRIHQSSAAGELYIYHKAAVPAVEGD